MTVLYQGVPGAFAHEACLAFVPKHEARPLPTLSEVAAAVASGEAEFGLLPVRNSRAGEVEGVRALIETAQLRIEAEYELPVRMHLLALPGVDLRDVTAVVSHPVALRQCGRAIARMGLECEEAPNTAMAAQSLADRCKAVLASEAAARLYGLTIIVRDLQDDPDNRTTFALTARR